MKSGSRRGEKVASGERSREQLLPTEYKSNYATFSTDPKFAKLSQTNDTLMQSNLTVQSSELVAQEILTNLESQRNQIVGSHSHVRETSQIAKEAQTTLKKIANRARRKKVLLWLIILLLAVINILVFYYLFIKRKR